MAFKVGLVGCGGIAQVHGQALKQLRDVEMVAAADIREERASSFCENYGGSHFSSLSCLLKNEKIDVLHICTPHYLHVPIAIEALKQGISVLMEKPAATNPKELEDLKKAIRDSGKAFGVCFQNRYLPAAQRAYELVNSGEAGRLLGARAFVTWRRDEKYYTESGWRGSWDTECGGVLINQAIHTLDLMLWLAGDPVKVEGSIRNYHLKDIIEVEDTAEAYFEFEAGARGLFYASTAYCTDAPVMLELCYENMILTLTGDELRVKWGKEEEIFRGKNEQILAGKE